MVNAGTGAIVERAMDSFWVCLGGIVVLFGQGREARQGWTRGRRVPARQGRPQGGAPTKKSVHQCGAKRCCGGIAVELRKALFVVVRNGAEFDFGLLHQGVQLDRSFQYNTLGARMLNPKQRCARVSATDTSAAFRKSFLLSAKKILFFSVGCPVHEVHCG
jgi:hypothetical protein